MIVMTERFVTSNGMVMTVETEYKYVSIVHASDYYENEEGLMILWWNPYVCNGESQLDSEIFPPTIGGLMRLTREAKALNTQIKKEVGDNTFTFRR